MSYIHPVIIAVIQQGERYLLTLRQEEDGEDKNFHNYWQLPGGGMEFGEDPEQTVKREILEEVGVEIDIIRLVPKMYTETRDHWQGVFICYLCKLKDSEAKIVLNEEASAFGWYTLEEIRKLKILPKTVEIIQSSLK